MRMLKPMLCLLFLASVIAAAYSAEVADKRGAEVSPATFATIDSFDQVKQMGRGVNIIGYDPIWKDFEKARFKERHFERIRKGGFQTVRVNLQAFAHMDAENRLDPAWLKTLDWVVKGALDNGLTVIIDEHDYEPCGKDAALCRTKLLAFWDQIAELYRNAPNRVVFEILNEPNSELTPELWNALLNDALVLIRKTNATRNVVVGPAKWNSVFELKSLELPSADRNLIVTVHYYHPMTFTHQGARWNQETASLSGVTWGTEAEKEKVREDFGAVQRWSEAERRPILLGEFGAYDKGDLKSRVRYTAYVARTAESFGWAWTYWQFDSDFIVYNIDKDRWVRPIKRALVP